MEVKPGYKQTEVGVIPEDWEVHKLPEVSWFQEGPGLRNWQFTSTGMKVINVTNLENGVLHLERTDRNISIPEFTRMYQHFAVEDADIVMASSGNSYSKTAIVRKLDLPLVMNTSVIRFKPSKTCDYGFLWLLLNSPLFKGQIDLMITGGAQPNFGPFHLKRINVPVPSLPEQRAIAGALSDVDGLLGALDRLIAKKRDLKQAAMQQLLTGQTRLPGFATGKSQFKQTEIGLLPDDWEVERVQQLATIKTGSRNTQDRIEDGAYPFFVRSSTIERINSYSFDGEAVLTAGDGVGTGKVFHYINGKFDIHQRVYKISDFSPRLVGRFFFLVFSTRFHARIMSMTAKSSVDSVRMEMIADMLIPLPSASEQTAIAEVLSDMDAELATLEQRREKTRALKQGMMQELLTGRTRLV